MTDNPQTTPVEGYYHPSFAELISWFNRWLNEPLSAREIVLLGETVDYLATNTVKRFDLDKLKIGSDLSRVAREEAEHAGI